MKRIKCIISYDGTDFNGYQLQTNQRTVQREVERALTKIHKHDIKSHASGRTDSGVHANGQVIHFDTTLSISDEKWPVALNGILPKDIVVLEAETVSSDFHARYSAVKKEYRYFICLRKINNVFTRNYSYHYPYQLNIEAIEQALTHLKGSYDFTSFCSTKTDKENKVRTIYTAEVEEKEEQLVFTFVGDGFLYNMVRIFIGTLLKVGAGRIQPEDIPAIIEGKNRKLAGPTAPGNGLHLWKVYYS